MPRNPRGKGRAKQTPLITTRLNQLDNDRFEQLCVSTGKTRTQVAREALLLFIDGATKLEEGAIRDALAERIRKMEDRIAALLARVSMDIGIVDQVLWIRSDPNERERVWSAAAKFASNRLHRKLTGGDKEIKELIKSELQPSEATQQQGTVAE